MNLKIYQSFYRPEHLEHLDSDFHHIDNSNDPLGPMCEYPIHLKCYEKAVASNTDVWGLVSWSWKQKLTGIDSQKLIKFINQNPGYDVYFINPVPEPESISYNLWEQGSWIHADIIPISEHIFPLMGIDVNILYQPVSYSKNCLASYYFGNKKFWDKWLAFAHLYVSAIHRLPKEVFDRHNGPAGYPQKEHLNYYPFIYERLFSTFLLLNEAQLTVKYYNYGLECLEPIFQELSVIKNQAVELKNRDLIYKWYEKRTNHFSIHRNYAIEWLHRLNW